MKPDKVGDIAVGEEKAPDDKREGENKPIENPEPQVQSAAALLAARHKATTTVPHPPLLLDRLSQLESLLQAIHQHFIQTSPEALAYSITAEWILDNYYVVQQSLRLVIQDLPPAYYQELPKLSAENTFQGLPRTFALAHHIVQSDQCHFEMERLKSFLHGYQESVPLTVGEVWALPIMLRISLLECLVQAAARATPLVKELEALSPAFCFSLEAADKDIVANCIISLRQLDSRDWQTFFEDVSLVEHVLRQDPARLYALMTFNTRDQYRKVIESLALTTGQSEQTVAQTAIRLAQSACVVPLNIGDGTEWSGLRLPPACHVGYYIVGPDREKLEQALSFRPSLVRRWGRWWQRRAVGAYLGSIMLLTALILGAMMVYAAAAGGVWWHYLLLAGLGFIPATALAVGLVNWVVTSLVPPPGLA